MQDPQRESPQHCTLHTFYIKSSQPKQVFGELVDDRKIASDNVEQSP